MNIDKDKLLEILRKIFNDDIAVEDAQRIAVSVVHNVYSSFGEKIDVERLEGIGMKAYAFGMILSALLYRSIPPSNQKEAETILSNFLDGFLSVQPLPPSTIVSMLEFVKTKIVVSAISKEGEESVMHT